MRSILLITLFSLGLIWTIIDRFRFEKDPDAEKYRISYKELYRKNNTLTIIIFAVVIIEHLMRIMGGSQVN